MKAFVLTTQFLMAAYWLIIFLQSSDKSRTTGLIVDYIDKWGSLVLFVLTGVSIVFTLILFKI